MKCTLRGSGARSATSPGADLPQLSPNFSFRPFLKNSRLACDFFVVCFVLLRLELRSLEASMPFVRARCAALVKDFSWPA